MLLRIGNNDVTVLAAVLFVLMLSSCSGGESTSTNADPSATFETTINAATSNAIVGSDSLSVTVDFGTVVSDFEASDVQVIGGVGVVLIDIDTADNQVFTLVFSIPVGGVGTLQIQILSDSVMDSGGRTNTATPVLNFAYDKAFPVPVLSSSVGENTNTSPIPVSADFGEAVMGFDLNDVTVTGGTVANLLDDSNGFFTFNINPAGDGLIGVSIAADLVQDASSNGNIASNTLNIIYDATQPAVVLSSTASNPGNSSPIVVSIVFSEAVTGLALTDLQVSGASAGNLTPVDGQNYSVDLTPVGDGLVSVNLPAVMVSDAAGNTNTSSNTLNRTYDSNAPVPAISSTASSPTVTSPIVIDIDFGESVTGLTLGEISVTNGAAANLVDLDGQNYTVDITPATDGVVLVALAAGVVLDAVDNPSLASNNFSITYQAAGVTVYYQEDFDAYVDGAAWPAPWVAANNSPVVSATIQSGQACLEGFVWTGGMAPSGQNNLARMVNIDLSVQDFEARYDMIYEDFQNQGGGFYGRQNGGFLFLNENAIQGEGYVFFLKGYTTDQLTFWYEIVGDEIPHHEVGINSVLDVAQGQLVAAYFHVVYQVQQISATETRQRAKIWLSGDPEPTAWQIVSDGVGSEIPGTNPMAISELQNLAGGFAIDLYNASNPSIGSPVTQSLCVDNLLITELQQSEGPLEGTGSIALVVDQYAGSGLGFLEGPVWRQNEQVLLFTDISNDRIYQLDPSGDALSIYRSGAADGSEPYGNGLANDANGDLLIAEQSTQSIVRRFSNGSEVTVVDNYSGLSFNSPNDLVSHTNGGIYFTDPTYGNLFDPGLTQPMGYQAIYRIDALGALTQIALLNQPNGIALSPDQSRLYVTESSTSTLRVYGLNGDGSVSGELPGESFSTAGTGGGGGDGIAVDTEGNLYIATTNGVWVVAPDGSEWGLISTPQPVRNIAFGGVNQQTLYMTLGTNDLTTGSLYQIDLNIPGLVSPYGE